MYASYLTENVWNHNNTSLNDAQGKITLIIQHHMSKLGSCYLRQPQGLNFNNRNYLNIWRRIQVYSWNSPYIKSKLPKFLLSDLMSYMRSEIVHIYGHYYEIFFDEFNIAIAIEYVYRAYFVINNNWLKQIYARINAVIGANRRYIS